MLGSPVLGSCGKATKGFAGCTSAMGLVEQLTCPPNNLFLLPNNLFLLPNNPFLLPNNLFLHLKISNNLLLPNLVLLSLLNLNHVNKAAVEWCGGIWVPMASMQQDPIFAWLPDTAAACNRSLEQKTSPC